jgi:glycosyltransferase involved in cell wall biosynthesis
MARHSTAISQPRVLHVLASLTFGGIETWLMHMLRHRDDFSVNHEILLTRGDPGEYEDEARNLGIPIHKLQMGSSKRSWLRSFRKFLQANGPFEVVHSHVYLFSAAVLEAAKREKVPVRIAHCHAARSRDRDHATVRSRIRRALAILWLNCSATRKIGISEAAIEEIAGRNWRRQPKSCVLLYGFDFSPYRGAADRARRLRKRLGINEDAVVIGHVGRFEAVKNHPFLLDAFAAMLRSVPDAQLVLVGDGSQREQVAAKADSMGIGTHVHFVGTTNDVPAYMGLFDLFVLPSSSEGLGIVLVEAQAAGTPAIASDGVVAEAAVIPRAVRFLPLSDGADKWGSAMAEAVRSRQRHRNDWLNQIEQSRFAMARCIDELDEIYRTELARSQ